MSNTKSISLNYEELREKFLGKRKAQTSVRLEPDILPHQDSMEEKVKEIEALIAKELPGYQLVKRPLSEDMKKEVELYIEELQAIVERDLPNWTLAQSTISSIRNDPTYRHLQSIRVQPKNGGAEKVAAIYAGNISVIQG